MTEADARARLAVLAVVAVSLFSALFIRLWYLQVLASPEYLLEAERNQVQIVAVPAPRGRILDRAGEVLVENRVSLAVAVDRSKIRTVGREDALLRELAAILRSDKDILKRKLDDVRVSRFVPVPVEEDVSEATILSIRERQARGELPEVVAGEILVRDYPHGRTLVHVLGYVGEINDAELDLREAAGYRLGDEIGKSGVEKVYESDLRGDRGLVKLEVDNRGRVLGELGSEDPVPGNDVQLTIDLEVQTVAEEALAAGLEAARKRRSRDTGKFFPAPAGSVVVLDVTDGSVIAMASLPNYEPTLFLGGISQSEFSALQEPESFFPLNNRAIQGQYAPGSTFKMITAAAALQSGLINPTTTVNDTGSLKVGNRLFRNAGSRPYGRVAVREAITVSSDVFFYTLGRDFWQLQDTYGETAIQDMARAFGFGVDSGILLPSEQDGFVPTPQSRAERHEANPEAFPEGGWFTGDNVNLSIGQGDLVVTPLQLANAYAQFASGGIRYVPRIASAVLSPDNELVRDIDPSEPKTIDLPLSVRDPILAGLDGVTRPNLGGTARAAFLGFPLERFPIAGKTGTAQVRGKEDTGLFVAFGPANSPKYVVAVVMEEAGFGSSAAAPVARRIFDHFAGVTNPAEVTIVPGGSN